MLPELRTRLIGTALLILWAALLAGCPSTAVRPPTERPPDAAAAERLVREGKAREAAQMFERLAALTTAPAERAQHQLRAVEQWLAAGSVPDAERVLALVSGPLSGEQTVSRALLDAEVALASDDAARALKALRGLPPPASPAIATRTLALQARAQFASGNAVAGVQSLLERERWLSGSEALTANRQLMVEGLRSA